MIITPFQDHLIQFQMIKPTLAQINRMIQLQKQIHLQNQTLLTKMQQIQQMEGIPKHPLVEQEDFKAEILSHLVVLNQRSRLQLLKTHQKMVLQRPKLPRKLQLQLQQKCMMIVILMHPMTSLKCALSVLKGASENNVSQIKKRMNTSSD